MHGFSDGDNCGVTFESGETITGSPDEIPEMLLERACDAASEAEQKAILQTYVAFCEREAPSQMSVLALGPVVSLIGDPEWEAVFWLKVGCAMENRCDYEAAALAYRQASQRTAPNDHTAYFINNNLGFSLIQLREFEEAEEFCMAALKIEPGLPNAYKNCALALVGQGRLVEAARILIAGAEVYPADGRGLRILKQLLLDHPCVRDEMPGIDYDIARCEEAVPSSGLGGRQS
jgi:tetratricopeptide (TPR) repeat protein